VAFVLVLIYSTCFGTVDSMFLCICGDDGDVFCSIRNVIRTSLRTSMTSLRTYANSRMEEHYVTSLDFLLD
jgi:hypothetical protein